MTLEEHLKEFSKINGDDKALSSLMGSVASHFLYGGYFIVGDSKIELTDIEFYYHEEGEEGKIHDWIMYHINHRCKNGKYTAFKFGSLNAHVSGVDFTFEDPDAKYRASILIRGASLDGGIPETRPTYIYEYFMMHHSVFRDGFGICWHDLDYDPDKDTRLIEPEFRKNVPQYYDETCDTGKQGDRVNYADRGERVGDQLKLGGKTYIQCQRRWRFRKPSIDILK